MLFFQAGRYAANPSRSAEWNRGAYLTQALGHCGACHSPHNYFGGERTAEALTGGEFLDEIADEVVDDKITPLDESTVRTWSAANLTPARADWAPGRSMQSPLISSPVIASAPRLSVRWAR